MSACAYGRSQLVIADTEGSLYFVNRHLELMCFKAYELSVSHLFQMKQHNILVSIGVSKKILISVLSFFSAQILVTGSIDIFSFSERELMFTFAIYRRPSICLACRLSVCLSVTFMHPTQPIEIFSNVSAPFNTLVT